MFNKFLCILMILLVALISKYTIAYENDMRHCQNHDSRTHCEMLIGDYYYTVGGFAFGSKE